MRKGIVLYLHVHQPWRLRQYSIFDIAQQHNYFAHSPVAEQDNELLFYNTAEASYLPMNALLERLLKAHPDFKLSLSITGTFLEQAEAFAPDVLESFQRLVATGQVEIVAETYYHSLSFFVSRPEFVRQVAQHQQAIRDYFGVDTQVFRNTELAYNNELAVWAEQAGFRGILAEGWDPVLGWRSPNYVYRPTGTQSIGLLLKNYRLSDDIAFRFSDQTWADWPLTAETYLSWVKQALTDAPLLNLFLNYETFGEHQKKDTGIFDFFEQFVTSWLTHPDHTFYTVSEAVTQHEPQGDISMPHTVTWADRERDLTAWMGNDLQRAAQRYLYALEPAVITSGNDRLLDDWRRLQTADHFAYMATKHDQDAAVHAYFSPYESPYDAFLYYMNALRDIEWRTRHERAAGAYHGK